MARRFKRRRARVAWMPTFGGAPVAEGTSAPFPGIETELTLDGFIAGTDVAFDAVPLTFDVSQSAVESQASPADRTLRDIVEGNEWRLRRIVGKAFISSTHGTQGASSAPLLDVALGFIVCKTYDDGAPWTDFSEVNPLSQESMEDPWIWRRRWILNPWNAPGILAQETTSSAQNSQQYWGYPRTNAGYGSIADGPHIDAKTARVIHRSERLFAVLAARRYGVGAFTSPAPADTYVTMLLDYRLLGSLRGQSYGNRGNTSR